MLNKNACLAAAAAAAVAMVSSAYGQTPIIDGTLDASYGAPFAVQTVNTGFGDNQSELDAGYARIENGKLYLMLTGNVESNFNKLVLFFDTREGGQNVMRGDNPDLDFNNLNTRYVGMTFDAGFSPDYTIFYSRGLNGENHEAYPNFSELNTNGGGLGGFLGTVPLPNPGQQGSATVGGNGGLPTLEFGYNDTNTGGVAGNVGDPPIQGAAADQAAAAAVTTGTEMAFELPAIGATGNFKLFVGINGSSHDFWSNQFLPGLTPTGPNNAQGNLGSDGLGNFIAPGSVSAVNFNNLAGDQFLTINYTVPSFEWDNAGNGNWGGNTNWTADTIPNQVDAIATLGDVAGAAARTVTLDLDVRVQKLVFNSAGGYTVNGTNTLTVKGNAAVPAVVVSAGNHVVNAPLSLGATTNFGVAAGSQLDVTNLVANNNAVVKTGAGAVRFNNVRTTSLNVAEGTAAIIPNGTATGVSRMDLLIVAGGATPTAQLDITNNGLVLDYTPPPPPTPIEGGDNSPLAETRELIVAGRAGGTWTGQGLTSSSAAANPNAFAVGIAEASAVLGVEGGTFMGQTVDGSTVLVRYTRVGDANLDGITNISDFALLAANFNLTDTGWNKGDFNYDGATNIGDFSGLAANFNQSAASLPRTAIPEPTALGLLGVAAIGALRRRRA